MSRISECFRRARGVEHRLLVPFLMAGDPADDWTVDLMHAAVAAGADILELGIPFSDPMADGVVIQRAHERALSHGVDLSLVLDLVARFRTRDPDTPVVLMGYLNPIENFGYAAFSSGARKAGVDGVIVVDMPLEESIELDQALRAEGLDLVFLLSPTTDPDRIRAITAAARGFLYYVALRGVTGAAHLDLLEARTALAAVRSATDKPVALGFGIDGPDSAREAASFADAVVVGSALVARIAALQGQRERALAEVGSFIGSLRAAMGAMPSGIVARS
ncbi:MAG: tryptophan synthase subunit alpha [Acidiferrobacteraceae bacterium]